MDTENGHWSYRSDTLSVTIDRHSNDQPLVWFVAEVYMRDNEYRSAFANEGRTGRTPLQPWIISRRNNAVLLITGDNVVHMDAKTKGTIIRDGYIFNTYTKSDVFAWDPLKLTMRLFPKNTYTADSLLAQGYENTYGFGPILVHDGEIDIAALEKNFVYDINPRAGIGMVEPGHFFLIVVDGRRPDYSRGITLTDYANMFKELGCTEAYNLDGGVSACMIFMGEQLNSHGNVKDYSQQRHMPDGLVIGYSRQVPTENDPIYNTGSDASYTRKVVVK